MTRLEGIAGCGRPREENPDAVAIGSAVHHLHEMGYMIGTPVRVGVVTGVVVGYNIARSGPYPGTRFPLLVATMFGVAKCCADEVERA